MADVKELLSKVDDEQVRNQLSEQFDELSGSTLRKQLEDAQTENKTLKQEKRHRTYAEAGLPDGAYDVFDQLYDGELSVEGLQGFAKEKGFALPEGGTGDEGQEGGGEQPASEGPSGDERLQQTGAGTIPARDLSDQDKAEKALGEGDVTAAIKHNLSAMHNA